MSASRPNGTRAHRRRERGTPWRPSSVAARRCARSRAIDGQRHVGRRAHERGQERGERGHQQGHALGRRGLGIGGHARLERHALAPATIARCACTHLAILLARRWSPAPAGLPPHTDPRLLRSSEVSTAPFMRGTTDDIFTTWRSRLGDPHRGLLAVLGLTARPCTRRTRRPGRSPSRLPPTVNWTIFTFCVCTSKLRNDGRVALGQRQRAR